MQCRSFSIKNVFSICLDINAVFSKRHTFLEFLKIYINLRFHDEGKEINQTFTFNFLYTEKGPTHICKNYENILNIVSPGIILKREIRIKL